MIIDCHAHLSAPPEMDDYWTWLRETKGAEGRGSLKISDDAILEEMDRAHYGVFSHLDAMERNGVDLQLVSPRPNQMMHSFKPGKVVQWFAEETNNLVYRQTQLWPGKFIGVAALPEIAGEPLDLATAELERCVTELDFAAVF